MRLPPKCAASPSTLPQRWSSRWRSRLESGPAQRPQPWPPRARALGLGCVLGWLLLAGGAETAWAIALFLRDGGPPVIGYFEREDEEAVVVREELPGGGTRQTRVLKSQIAERIDAAAPQRLQALSPDRPADYLEYAEELAERRRDPEARQTAVRLYVIAIARGDEHIRQGAWRGLVELARTPEERQTFLAAAAWHGVVLADILQQADESRSQTRSAAREALLEALVRLRQGRAREAQALLERPAVREEANVLDSWLTWEQLKAACNQQELELPLLAKLVQAELTLRAAPADPSAATRPSRWSQARAGKGLAPLLPLELDALTPFDPAECVWRDGRWQRP